DREDPRVRSCHQRVRRAVRAPGSCGPVDRVEERAELRAAGGIDHLCPARTALEVRAEVGTAVAVLRRRTAADAVREDGLEQLALAPRQARPGVHDDSTE